MRRRFHIINSADHIRIGTEENYRKIQYGPKNNYSSSYGDLTT